VGGTAYLDTEPGACPQLLGRPRLFSVVLHSTGQETETKDPRSRRRTEWAEELFRAMSRLMLKSAKRALLIENLRSLRGLGKMRVR
jgi:hypothetical protein